MNPDHIQHTMTTFPSPDPLLFTCPPRVMHMPLLVFTLTVAACIPLRAQTSAVVHQFNLTVSEELTTELSVKDRSRTVLKGYSVGTALPEELVDSMAVDAERELTKKLGIPVHMCWTKGKRGTGAGSFLGPKLIGLPSNTFKLAKEYCPGETRFVELNCTIAPGGSVSIGEGTKLKPMVTMTMQVFDGEKNEVMEKKVKLKDFGKLRSRTE